MYKYDYTEMLKQAILIITHVMHVRDTDCMDKSVMNTACVHSTREYANTCRMNK